MPTTLTSEATTVWTGDLPTGAGTVTLVGVVLALAGVPGAVGIAAAAAFVAAFLNAVFDYCLGCQIYLLLVRFGLLNRSARVRGA